MPHIVDCEIMSNQEVAPGHYRMTLHAPQIAADAMPGQFCMIEVRPGYAPFLRRPMSFERFFKDGFSILFRVQGEGTRLMSMMSSGQILNIQGPLGKPFPLDPAFERHLIVAGGIGIAPFPALADAMVRQLGKTPDVVIAARTGRMLLCEKDFRQMGCRVHFATDDGSAGEKENAADALRRLQPGPDSAVYACGPMPMLKAAHAVCAASGAVCYASLEAEMACGDGVCLGCVVQANVEVDNEHMVRVCKDGPVFDSRIIRWDVY